MTTQTETKTEAKKARKPADLYLFEGDGDTRKIVGSIYFHGKGKGLNVVMGSKRYSAFAPKAKTATAAQGEGA